MFIQRKCDNMSLIKLNCLAESIWGKALKKQSIYDWNVSLQIQKSMTDRLKHCSFKKKVVQRCVHKLEVANKHTAECFEMFFISFRNGMSYILLWFK